MALETQDIVVLVAALIGAAAAIVAAIIPLRRRRKKRGAAPASWVKRSHRPLTLGTKQVVGVRAGNYQDLEMRLVKGDCLEGFVVETRGRPVRVLLVDVPNLVTFHNDRAFEAAWLREGEGGYTLAWEAPADGSWFLVVDAQREADEREVEVLLHRAAQPATA